MRNVLLFGPLLWLRKIILVLLVILLVLGFLLFFAANSPLAIKKVADTIAGDYNITYDSIEGNALNGVSIANPCYKGKSLAKNIKLKWNPNTLAGKIIKINTLQIEEGNINVIKGMMAAFSSEENTTTRSSESESSFDFTVNAENIDISLAPFVQNNIRISKATLNSEKLLYNEDTFFVEGLAFELDTNVTHISLEGSMKEGEAALSTLVLEDVNLTSLRALFSTGDSKKEENEAKEASPSIFTPKRITVQNLRANILPFAYEPIKVKQIQLDATDVTFDVEHLVLQDASLDLNATTNLSIIRYKGKAHNNHLLGNINLTPNNRLYELYGLPLRKKAIANVIVDFNASIERVVADIRAKGKHILKGKKGEFNVDIDSFTSHVVYDINSANIKVNTKATVSTPYAKNITLTNVFTMDKKIHYEGTAKVKNLIGIDTKFTKPLEELKVTYSGDDTSITSIFHSSALSATFDSTDFKTGELHVETLKTLRLSAFVALPNELKDAKVHLIADMPLNFKNLSKINAKVKVASNVVNIDADVAYSKAIALKGKVVIPKDSLLKAYNKALKWEALSPLDSNMKFSDNSLFLKLKAKALNADIHYGLKNGSLKGKVNIAGLVTNISGSAKQKLHIQTKITSMKTLGKKLSTLYAIEELPPLEGKITASLQVNKLQTAELTLASQKLIYKADRKTKHIIKDIKLVASMDASKVVLKSYRATFNKQKYFSNKKATIALGEKIEVSNLWINDELKVTGKYDSKRKKGNFLAEAKSFHIKDKVADIYTQIHLNTELDGESTTVKGKVVLLKGRVTPNLQAGKSFASDSDIIIIQEMKKKKKSPFMDNLSLALKIETKQALHLKQGPMNVRLKPDFSINKSKGGELLYFGSVGLLQGGTYKFEKKKFALDKSFIYFTGNVNKPLLDIKAKYKSINHLITIAITDTPAAPNINFSSSPSLTREQILSVILFDTESGGDTQSGNDMMKMMGGAMAKAALSDVGIEVDHLAFGEGNSVEVGKKLTNKITVIYINAEVPKVKLKYQHGKHTESVIGVSEESQSIDIIYKRDF